MGRELRRDLTSPPSVPVTVHKTFSICVKPRLSDFTLTASPAPSEETCVDDPRLLVFYSDFTWSVFVPLRARSVLLVVHVTGPPSCRTPFRPPATTFSVSQTPTPAAAPAHLFSCRPPRSGASERSQKTPRPPPVPSPSGTRQVTDNGTPHKPTLPPVVERGPSHSVSVPFTTAPVPRRNGTSKTNPLYCGRDLYIRGLVPPRQ